MRAMTSLPVYRSGSEKAIQKVDFQERAVTTTLFEAPISRSGAALL
jgi:hypothetical protein